MAFISAGEVAPGVELLIDDDGNARLRSEHGEPAVPLAALGAALERIAPVADLVARSRTPISGMSPAIERSLEHFGCAKVEG